MTLACQARTSVPFGSSFPIGSELTAEAPSASGAMYRLRTVYRPVPPPGSHTAGLATTACYSKFTHLYAPAFDHILICLGSRIDSHELLHSPLAVVVSPKPLRLLGGVLLFRPDSHRAFPPPGSGFINHHSAQTGQMITLGHVNIASPRRVWNVQPYIKPGMPRDSAPVHRCVPSRGRLATVVGGDGLGCIRR